MLEVLPEETRRILLSYDFVRKYFDGRLSKEDFLEQLKPFVSELLEKGVSKEHLRNLYKSDDEHEFHRKASYNRFVRFARKTGLDIATKEDKVRWIKSASAEQFLDIVSISNSLLRGLKKFLRWRKFEPSDDIVVENKLGVTELQPPQNSHKIFEEFFNLMKDNISTKNIDIWALKLYFAIILLHIFPDGNGRTARNAYFALKSTGLLDETKSTVRVHEINQAITFLITSVILVQFEREGINVKNFRDVEYYRAEKDPIIYATGWTSHLKYLAAKRVIQSRNMYSGQQEIVYGNWASEMIEKFEIEYVKVRVELFWIAMSMLEKLPDRFFKKLDSILTQ